MRNRPQEPKFDSEHTIPNHAETGTCRTDSSRFLTLWRANGLEARKTMSRSNHTVARNQTVSRARTELCDVWKLDNAYPWIMNQGSTYGVVVGKVPIAKHPPDEPLPFNSNHWFRISLRCYEELAPLVTALRQTAPFPDSRTAHFAKEAAFEIILYYRH